MSKEPSRPNTAGNSRFTRTASGANFTRENDSLSPSALNKKPIPQAPSRPSSATVRFSARQHHTIVQQLRNTIAETNEAPPRGSDVKKIERRRELITKVLKDVEEKGLEARRNVQEFHNSQYRKAAEKQMEKEATIASRCATRESVASQNRQYHIEDTKAELQGKVQWIEAKQEKCFKHLEDKFLQRMGKCDEENDRREAQLRKLENKRTQEKQERQMRMEESRRRCEELQQRREETARQERLRLERVAEERRKAAEKRLNDLGNKKKENSRKQDDHRKEAVRKAALTKVSAVITPSKVMLRSVERDFSTRWQELKQSEEEQKERYNSKEGQDREGMASYLQHRKQYRERIASENLEKVTQEHLQRNEEIKKNLAAKSAFVEKMRQQRQQRLNQEGSQLSESIARHRQEAQRRWDDKLNNDNAKTFNRWNRRADNIMAHLLETYTDFTATTVKEEGHRGESSPTLRSTDRATESPSRLSITRSSVNF